METDGEFTAFPKKLRLTKEATISIQEIQSDFEISFHWDKMINSINWLKSSCFPRPLLTGQIHIRTGNMHACLFCRIFPETLDINLMS